jgi:hypothetical protein
MMMDTFHTALNLTTEESLGVKPGFSDFDASQLQRLRQTAFTTQMTRVQALFEQSVSLFSTLAATLDVPVAIKAPERSQLQWTKQATESKLSDEAEQMRFRQRAVQQQMDSFSERITQLRRAVRRAEANGYHEASIASLKECADSLQTVVNGLSLAANARPDLFSTAAKH